MAKSSNNGILSLIPSYSRGSHTSLLNDPDFVRIFTQLALIALSRYSLEGLPESMPEKYVKQILFTHGRISFSLDPILNDVIALQVTGDECRDIYGEPKFWRGHSWNGEYQRQLSNADGVIVYENQLKIAIQFIAIQYAETLMKIYKAMRTNLSSTRTPMVINVTKIQQRQIEKMLRDLDEDAHFLFVESDGIRLQPVTSLSTQPTFYVDRLQSAYMTEFNNYLTAIGVNNSNIEKKERVNTQEVAANNVVNETQSSGYIKELEIGFDKVNEFFGTNIKVVENKQTIETTDINETESSAGGSDKSKSEGSNET